MMQINGQLSRLNKQLPERIYPSALQQWILIMAGRPREEGKKMKAVFSKEIFSNSAVMAEIGAMATWVAFGDEPAQWGAARDWEGNRLNPSWFYAEGEGCDPFRNPNQRVIITLNGLTIEGERCALWGNECRPLMTALKESGIAPVRYETSDSRLYWWETLESYTFSRRATVAEFVLYLGEREWPLYVLDKYRPDWRQHIPAAGTAEYRRAVAAGTLPAAEVYRALARLDRSSE